MKKFSEETKKMKQPVEGSNHAATVSPIKAGLPDIQSSSPENRIEYYGGVLLFKTNHRHK